MNNKRGDDIRNCVTELANAMQRAQILGTPAWDKLCELDNALKQHYTDSDGAFFGRISAQSRARARDTDSPTPPK